MIIIHVIIIIIIIIIIFISIKANINDYYYLMIITTTKKNHRRAAAATGESASGSEVRRVVATINRYCMQPTMISGMRLTICITCDDDVITGSVAFDNEHVIIMASASHQQQIDSFK